MAALTLLGSAVVFQAPASAAPGWDRCPRNRMCVFEHPNGQGRFAYFAEGASDLSRPIGGFVFNDKISSMWNRHRFGFCVNRASQWRQPMFVAVGESRPFNLPAAYNDQTSSLSYRHSNCTSSHPRLP
jgi:Peptidase inhibitor family I36